MKYIFKRYLNTDRQTIALILSTVCCAAAFVFTDWDSEPSQKEIRNLLTFVIMLQLIKK